MSYRKVWFSAIFWQGQKLCFQIKKTAGQYIDINRKDFLVNPGCWCAARA
jgi:hypothetical protein